MKKKKLIISLVAVMLAVVTVGSVFGVKAYKAYQKSITPVPGIFLELPDRAMLYYYNEAGEFVDKELSQEEILLLHNGFQELITHFVGTRLYSGPISSKKKNYFDEGYYKTDRYYKGTIEYYYDRPVEYSKIFDELDREADEFNRGVDNYFSFFCVCDKVIIQFENLKNPDRSGLVFVRGYNDEYYKFANTPIFKTADYQIFVELFKSML